MKYAELDRLERELIAHSDRDRRDDLEILKHAALGGPALRDPIVAQLIAKISARLYHRPPNPLVHQLCRGALIASLEGHLVAREFLPFALQLLQRASYASPSPVSVTLPDQTQSRARGYLERYTESPAAIDRLAEAARLFVQRNDDLASGILFARLLADLAFLQEIVRDGNRSEADRRIAAGALTYFAETHDAIDDQLGVVGMLDDAYIAQLACERIDSARRVKTALVDGVLAQWPFLGSLRLERAGHEWSPSEFVLLNLAVAYGPESSPRTAIVIPTVGSMPLWLGVLAAFGTLFDSLDRASKFRPKTGELIAVGGEDRIAEVVEYFHPPSGRPTDPAAPDTARMVKLRYLPRGPKAPRVVHTMDIKVLDACVPAPERRTRRTTLPSSKSDVPLGPLEHLFSLDQPARFKEATRNIIAVCPLGQAREFLTNTLLGGRPLVDVVPCGRAASEDDYAVQWWSPIRSGTMPVLTIARDVSEATAIVSRLQSKNVSVLFALSQSEWASSCVQQLADTRTVALLPQSATDAQAGLEALHFRFFDWTPELESSVSHRPRASAHNEIDAYESAVRRQLHAQVKIHDVDLEQVENGLATLKEFSRLVRSEYGDEVPGTLAAWAARSQVLFFDLAGAPVLLDDTASSRALSVMSELRAGVTTGARMWSEKCRVVAAAHLGELGAMLTVLQRQNPKEEAIHDLLADGAVVVRCSHSRWEDIQRRFPSAKRFVDAGNPIEGPALIFEWPGTQRLARILFPPIGDPTHVVFYGWERRGLERVVRARDRRLEDHWAPASRPEAWHLDDVPVSSRRAPLAQEAPEIHVVEEWQAGLRRLEVVARANAGATDELVEARPTFFSGSKYALFTPDKDVYVATHLVRAKRSDDARLEEKSARDLKPGDVVVLPVGSDRDTIRERADGRLPPGTRELARTWHRALRRLRERCPSDAAVYRTLRAAGCNRHEITVYGWLRSATQIGPHDDADVDVIMKATSDPELTAKSSECKLAIRRVRGEHLRASHELAARVIQELEARLGRGDSLDAAIELDDRVELLVVEAVDDELVRVSASATNFVQDIAG